MKKLFELFGNLTPKQKTLLEFAGMGVLIVLVNVIMYAVATHGWWFELGMAMMGYCIFYLVKILYQIRIEHWERHERLHRASDR